MPGLETLQGTEDKPQPLFKDKKVKWLVDTLKDVNPDIFDVIAKRQANRETVSDKIIKMGETAANATKAEGENLAHAVSAHGPGTDQMPRLVSGRRADEVAAESAADAKKGPNEAKATPSTSVTLTNGQMPTIEMPAWTKVGEDPSNVSSRFGSAAQMLHVVEEAFAQAALVEAKVAADNKALDAEAMTFPAVQKAAKELGEARTAANARRGEANAAAGVLGEAMKAAEEAETAGPGSEASIKAAAKVEEAKLALEPKVAAYHEASRTLEAALTTLREAKLAAVPGDRTALGETRAKVVVEPGGVIGESFKVGDDQKALQTGQDLTAEAMQKRYETVSHTPAMTTASVIMDPAFVKDEFGEKHRAGSQIQTAFPSSGDVPQRELTEADYQAMLTQAKADAALASHKTELKVLEEASKEAIAKRQANKEALVKLRETRKDIKGTIDDTSVNPEFMPDEDIVAVFKLPEKLALVNKHLDDNDAIAPLGESETIELPVAKARLEKAMKALAEKELKVQDEVATAEALDKELAKLEKTRAEAVAKKDEAVKALQAAAEKSAGETADEAARKVFEAAEAEAKKLAEEIAQFPETLKRAQQVIDNPPKDPNPQEVEERNWAEMFLGSEGGSLRRSAARRLKVAREAMLKEYQRQEGANEALLEGLTKAKLEADKALADAQKILDKNPDPGPEPKEEAYANVGEFKKAKGIWTGKTKAREPAAAGFETRRLAQVDAETKLNDTTLLITELKNKATAMAKLIEETDAIEKEDGKTK